MKARPGNPADTNHKAHLDFEGKSTLNLFIYLFTYTFIYLFIYQNVDRLCDDDDICFKKQ